MKLEKWALIAEIVGGLAIVVSLLFVGLEVQRNRVAQIQTGTNTVVSEYNATIRVLAADPEFACIYALGVQDYFKLSGSQRVRLSAYLVATFNAVQQMYSLFLQGAVDAETWAGFDGVVTEVFKLPGFQQWFATRELWYGDDFRNYIHGKIEGSREVEPVIYDDPRCTGFLEL